MKNEELVSILKDIFTEQEAQYMKWNFQSNGFLYINSAVTIVENGETPLSWETPLRIAKHPIKEIYAYASSSRKAIKDNQTSCICTYNPKSPLECNYFHEENVFEHGFDFKPAFSPNGSWLAFISTPAYGKICFTGDIIISPFPKQDDKIYNITSNLIFSGACKEFQWLNDNTILVEYPEKGFSKVSAITFNPSNPKEIHVEVLGNFKLDGKCERGGKLIAKGFNFSSLDDNSVNFLEAGKIERSEYTTSDKVISYYWIASPSPNRSNGRTLLLCQGGPHHAWEPEIVSGTYHIPLLQHLGYTIVMPIVHGMPGISVQFDDQVRGDWGGQCIKDYIDALDDAISKYHLDKDNVAVLGHSFGGFCAYTMNILFPERFKCFVSESGPFDLNEFIIYCRKPRWGKEEMEMRHYEADSPIWNLTIFSEMMDGLANPGGEQIMENMIKTQSPHNLIKRVQNIPSPILIIHGLNDKMVPYSQAVSAFTAFKDATLVTINEGHCFFRTNNIISRYIEILSFLDIYMK